MSPGNSRGVPLYLDETRRGIVESTDEGRSSKWHPSNAVAVKLWHCLEALRDVELVLEEASQQKNSAKRKRRLKQFSVHLYSLASAVVQLCDHIVGNRADHAYLPLNATKEIAQIKKEFLELVPIERKGDLAALRHKLGAHVDINLLPQGAQELRSRSTVSDMGRWLHICLHILLDLTKLDIYAWTCESRKDAVRLMTNEPFLVTFRLAEGKPQQILAIHVAKQSPRQTVAAVVGSVVRNSQWMFGSDVRRIGSLVIDNDSHWNTFARASDLAPEKRTPRGLLF